MGIEISEPFGWKSLRDVLAEIETELEELEAEAGLQADDNVTVTGDWEFSGALTHGGVDVATTSQLFSGAYGDLSGVPSTFTPETHGNEAHSTNYTDYTFSEDYTDLTNRTHGMVDHDSTVAASSDLFSGSYTDLTDVPNEFTPELHDNTRHTETYATETYVDGEVFSGSYTDLTNVPSTLVHDDSVTDITAAWNVDTSSGGGLTVDNDDVATEPWVDDNFNDYTFSENYGDLSGREHGMVDHDSTVAASSDLFSGSYTDLTDVPSEFTPEDHALGSHTASTLADLNLIVSDATLDDSGDERPPETHGNEAHSSTFATETYVDGAVFSGSYNDLTDVPDLVEEGDDVTVLSGASGTDGQVLTTDGTNLLWDTVEEGDGMQSHGNEYHSPDFLAETDYTPVADVESESLLSLSGDLDVADTLTAGRGIEITTSPNFIADFENEHSNDGLRLFVDPDGIEPVRLIPKFDGTSEWGSEIQFEPGGQVATTGDLDVDGEISFDQTLAPHNEWAFVRGGFEVRDNAYFGDDLEVFGSTIGIDHGDLDGVGDDDHHPRYEDSEAVSAINADPDHGSTAQHNYFSGSYTDLSDVPSEFTPEDHALGSHTASTLADLNLIVSDATLDDSGDERPPETHGNEAHSTNYTDYTFSEDYTDLTNRTHGNEDHSTDYAAETDLFSGSYTDLTDVPSEFTPEDHALGSHTASTLADLNLIVSDATLDDVGDERPPETHGNEAHSSTFATETYVDGEVFSGSYTDLTDVPDLVEAGDEVTDLSGSNGTDGQVLTTDGTNLLWDTVEEGDGMQSHGNEYHSPDFLAESDYTPVADVESESLLSLSGNLDVTGDVDVGGDGHFAGGDIQIGSVAGSQMGPSSMSIRSFDGNAIIYVNEANVADGFSIRTHYDSSGYEDVFFVDHNGNAELIGDLDVGHIDAESETVDEHHASRHPWADVIAHGADPTGQTDSSQAFADAFAANSFVYVPDGYYVIEQDIDVPDNSRLMGASFWNTLIDLDGATIDMQNTHRAHVGDLYIHSMNDQSGTGITLGNSHYWKLDNLWIENFEYGIDDNGDSWIGELDNITVDDCSGVAFNAAHNHNHVTYLHCSADDTPVGFSLDHGHGVNYFGCRAEKTSSIGWDIHPETHQLGLFGCYAEECGTAIEVPWVDESNLGQAGVTLNLTVIGLTTYNNDVELSVDTTDMVYLQGCRFRETNNFVYDISSNYLDDDEEVMVIADNCSYWNVTDKFEWADRAQRIHERTARGTSGPTSMRPDEPTQAQAYFDTDLGHMIWYRPWWDDWVDATGSTV